MRNPALPVVTSIDGQDRPHDTQGANMPHEHADAAKRGHHIGRVSPLTGIDLEVTPMTGAPLEALRARGKGDGAPRDPRRGRAPRHRFPVPGGRQARGRALPRRHQAR
ncbi:hypothetical protein [Nocardiopsis alba]|uniref:hypothetical protein n=1 Tax=Nocardiopsis alba TaxID=53437 RepID=UPI00034784C9|nr:hypothetical protein [Nocardiopsis alba]